jgi:galactoside 2-L-fucosyltransferase 1/2
MRPLSLKRVQYFLYFIMVLACVTHMTTPVTHIKVDRYIDRVGKRFLEAVSLRYRHRFNSSGDVHAVDGHIQTGGTVFHTYTGRFGNKLFQLAAITGIAKRNGMDICVREKETPELASILYGVGDGSSCEAVQPLRYILEDGYAMWQDFELQHQDTLLEGCFQSYKYIDPDLRTKLKFKPLIMSHARAFLQNFPERVLVGIHVRRYEASHLKTPSQAYFENAMEYFNHRYSNVGFVVVSDDPGWCNEQPHFHNDNVHIALERQHYALDMAILVACDHIIISVGTYGWWAAYLGPDMRIGGTVVYYDSEFSDHLGQNIGLVQVADYYPPSWIAIGDTTET